MHKVIHQIHIQGFNDMDEHLQKYCKMWMEMYGKDWEYKFWSDVEIIPFIAKNYKEYLDIYIDLSPVKKSDLSRLLILHHHGGMYCDTDTIPIKRIDKFLELFDEYDAVHSWESESDMSWKKHIMKEFTKFEDSPMKHKKIIGSAWMYSKPNCQIYIDFVNEACKRLDKPVLEQFSTWFLTRWVAENDIESKGLKMLHYSYCLSVLPTENSYLIHLYNFSWKENENDKPWDVY